MKFESRQVSSLEKLTLKNFNQGKQIHQRTVIAGERVSYQIGIKTEDWITVEVALESELSDYIKLYAVKNVIMDKPVTEPNIEDENYITMEPGLMPDLLLPLEEQNNRLFVENGIRTLWVRLDVPTELSTETYHIKIKFSLKDMYNVHTQPCEIYETMTIKVVDAVMTQQRLIYTRWFYADCIANQHNVEVDSCEYWKMIEKYIEAAVDIGINMILVPIHTPPLDTAIGTTRRCVQLVDIEKRGDKYEFGFDKFRHFIDICKKCGVEYFEMAHMFTQWGAKCAPNIMVTENGKKDYLFGWHVSATSKEYTAFLMQYVSAIAQELENEGISENTYFHISDEPRIENMADYRTASEMIRSLIGKSKTFDAHSDYEFYEKGLVECPVTAVHHIEEFLKHRIENQWVYYCCNPQQIFTNSFIAMPSWRTRILGYLLYRYNIKGFLHWGFNFYNGEISLYEINPYLTTSGNGAYPSGDPFIVYPGKECVYPSIRGEVTYEAIQDMNICFTLEELVGREEVIKMIDDAAGYRIRFDKYPYGNEYIDGLRAAMIERIDNYNKK